MIHVIFLSFFVLAFSLDAYAADLPIETIPSSETLPEKYPDTWVFAHDFNFYSIIDGKITIIDVAAPSSTSLFALFSKATSTVLSTICLVCATPSCFNVAAPGRIHQQRPANPLLTMPLAQAQAKT